MTDRKNPGYYGAEIEAWVVDKYDLERTYQEVEGVRLDALEPETGRPVEIKAVGRNRAGGRATESQFKIWKDQHDAVSRASGYYVFVLYDLLESGVAVLDSRAVRAGAVSPDWYGETEPRGHRQAELPARVVFE